MNDKLLYHRPASAGQDERYHIIVGMLQTILTRLEHIEGDVDEIDRTLRPHGDGTKLRRRA
jgi:hypothetical protein